MTYDVGYKQARQRSLGAIVRISEDDREMFLNLSKGMLNVDYFALLAECTLPAASLARDYVDKSDPRHKDALERRLTTRLSVALSEVNFEAFATYTLALKYIDQVKRVQAKVYHDLQAASEARRHTKLSRPTLVPAKPKRGVGQTKFGDYNH